jgi:hypothetical protein
MVELLILMFDSNTAEESHPLLNKTPPAYDWRKIPRDGPNETVLITITASHHASMTCVVGKPHSLVNLVLHLPGYVPDLTKSTISFQRR